jgi:16S rRNA C967 or C1407 C5-methylase (RsmB/RsmF family)
VKPGGSLIYSTCSVETDENEDVIEEVIGRDERFRLVNTTRTWPHVDRCDGFFIAVFQRRSHGSVAKTSRQC